tara:strand:- start:1103 stop:1243 length:141 start_codon:yes stop_codon:yes gene_type:complete
MQLATFGFVVALPLYRKTPLHKLRRLQRRYVFATKNHQLQALTLNR